MPVCAPDIAPGDERRDPTDSAESCGYFAPLDRRNQSAITTPGSSYPAVLLESFNYLQTAASCFHTPARSVQRPSSATPGNDVRTCETWPSGVGWSVVLENSDAGNVATKQPEPRSCAQASECLSARRIPLLEMRGVNRNAPPVPVTAQPIVFAAARP